MFRIEPSTRGAVPTLLGELAPTAPMDICDVVWEADGSMLIAYVQLERGLSLYDSMPYGLVRLDSKLRVREQRYPVDPDLCPMKPAPCTLFRAAGSEEVVFVTDAAYTLDARDFRPKGVLPEAGRPERAHPRLHGLVALLTGRYWQSKRLASEILAEVFQIPMSFGAVSNSEGACPPRRRHPTTRCSPQRRRLRGRTSTRRAGARTNTRRGCG